MTIPEHDKLLRGEPFQSDRTSGVQLVGGYADFRPESIFEAIRESGRALTMTELESTSLRNRLSARPGILRS